MGRIWVGNRYVPLALLFLCNAFTEAAVILNQEPVIAHYAGLARRFAICVTPLNLMLVPLFWLYVRGITSKIGVVCKKGDLLHFLPAIACLSIPMLALSLNRHDFISLFEPSRLNTNTHQSLVIGSVTFFETLVLIQAGLYSALIIRRLARYRATLSDFFASTEHLELKWISCLAFFLVGFVVFSVIGVVADDPLFSEPWESMVDFTVLWFVAIWGLRQAEYLASEVEATNRANRQGGKYVNSALSDARLTKIASEIKNAMEVNKLYRDADLSLRKVAEQINELPNYVSQALNRKIGESFFDYVNRWRIEEAKERLARADDNVLSIAEATGFNSRSSFYNAFKKVVGQTPSSYRKSHKLQ